MKKIINLALFVTITALSCIAFAQTEAPANHSEENPENSEVQKPHDERYDIRRNDDGTYTFIDLENKFISTAINKSMNSTARLMKLVGISWKRFGDKEVLGLNLYLVLSSISLFVIHSLVAFLAIKFLIPFLIHIFIKRKLFLLENMLRGLRPCITTGLIIGIFYFTFLFWAYSFEIITIYQPVFSTVFLTLTLWCVIIIFDVFSARIHIIAERKFGAKEILPILIKTARWFLIIILALFFLDKLDVNIKNLVLSLGIGGAALAFASKDTIANFFGSVSLIMDRPFKIGERIKVSGKLEGTVESIGMRSTRIRNLDETLSILPNSYLANEYIINVSRWSKRKVTFEIGLTYSTSAQTVKKIIEEINQLLNDDGGVHSESTSLVTFSSFGASSLNISVLYFTVAVDYVTFMLTQERINYAIMQIVAKNGADFAFPSTSIYVEKNAK